METIVINGIGILLIAAIIGWFWGPGGDEKG